ncbi:MAG: GGDEF domain-containing protein [Acidaminococcaceae bacterium]|nr:GGDEF domain-containing protein [Acidaminococcaceae bacterium]
MCMLIVTCGNLPIPNPEVLLLTGLVICASLFDFPAGVLCAIQVILFSMYFYSEDHSYFSYSTVNLKRMIIIFCSVLATTAFLGKLRQIWNTTRQKTMEVTKRLRDSNEALQEESHQDHLTGLYNRNMLRANFPDYKNRSLIVTLLDIDDFKKINDVCGHEAGDMALREVGTMLSDTFTNTDCYRYGGDEFLLVRLDDDWNKYNLEMIRVRAQLTRVGLGKDKLPIHISAGYISGVTENGEDLRTMFHLADEMLYESKRKGKNRVTGGTFRRDMIKNSAG